LNSLDRAIARLLPAVPKPIVRRLSSPYIAGPALDDAVRVVRRLNAEGKLATVDVLGEEVSTAGEAEEIAAQYLRTLGRIEADKLDANISVKLSGLGLRLDEGLCRRQLVELVSDADRRGIFVRLDMEDSELTDGTLRLYRELREAGCTNVGVVLQAVLRRTIDDVPGLDNVRVCKGIYAEPLAIAYHDPDEIRASFLEVLDALLERGAYVGIATHDEPLLDEALRRVRARGLAPSEVEFQMLLGVRPERGDALVRAGQRLRVYVPYGTHWYEYSVRRLQENPRIAGYVAADTLRRLRPPVRGNAVRPGG
jgi:proline dehydrogenase